MSKALSVLVCVWDPSHTLDRVEAQRDALRDGTIAKMIKEHGEGEALRAAMQRERLVSSSKSLRGDSICPECGTPMETLLARPGITDKVEAVWDVAQDIAAAIDRTRRAR
jgi:hypothetical protein